MKHTFTSKEIAHIWAHRGADYGKCPGNASFDGDAFKSYYTVICRRITHKGKTAYVLDRHGFSISTSRVQSRLREALSHEKVFTVDCGKRGQWLDFTPAKLIAYYLAESKAIETRLPSRLARIRAAQYDSATYEIEEAREVAEFFGLGLARIDSMLAKRAAGQSSAEETLKLAREKQIADKAKREAKDLEQRKRHATEQAEKFIANPELSTNGFLKEDVGNQHLLTPELAGRLVAAIKNRNIWLVDMWKNDPTSNFDLYFAPVMLRRVGDEMETSKGARVPLTDAKRTFEFCQKARARGWHRNGATHEIGHYQLDAVNEQGVIAGCHRVSWEEIEDFAKREGWVTV